MTRNIGVLLTNTGTPDAPTPSAVRAYLREFLSDRRIVQLPRYLWLPILYGAVLPLRPKRSAKLYQSIWTEQGSPMRVIMQSLRQQLKQKLQMPVEIGMNYGNPSIHDGLECLRQQCVDKVIVLPLYPQYSNTTTASSFDRVTAAIKKWPALPELHFIHDYADHPDYIKALAASIENHHPAACPQDPSPNHLLISFHGIPERLVKAGDPYAKQCKLTARLLTQALKLNNDQWTLCYQSQFGYDQWLQPATNKILTQLAQKGVRHLDIVCPGFAIDCLETLEEISIRANNVFCRAGGISLRYLPALNDSEPHINLLAHLISSC